MNNKYISFRTMTPILSNQQSRRNLLILLSFAISFAIGNLFLINLLNKFTTFSYFKFSILLLVVCCGFYLLSRPNIFASTRTAIFFLIPIIDITLPPKRFDFSVFTVLLIICLLLILIRLFLKKDVINIIPDKIAFLFFLSALLPVFFGFDPLHSFELFIKALMLNYIFFIMLYDFLSEKNAFHDIVKYLALALLFISSAIFFEFFTGINLSGAGKNINALKGFTRCAGFFQDPQKAAQFLAVGITFFTLLLCRNVPIGRTSSRLVSVSLPISVIALLLTASKNGIITGLSIPTIAAIFFNKNIAIKNIFLFFLLPLSIFMLIFLQSPLTSIFHKSSAGVRMTEISQSAETRINIWHESWLAFQNYGNLITGTGPGNYQELIMRADPGLRDDKVAGRYVPDQPESGYLKIFYETGMFGIIGLVLFLIGIAHKTAKYFFTPEPTVAADIAISASFALVTFSIGFATLFTVTDNKNLIIFVIMYTMLSYLRKNDFSLNGHDE